MKRAFIALAVLLSLAGAAIAQDKQPAAKPKGADTIEANVRKLWNRVKKKTRPRSRV